MLRLFALFLRQKTSQTWRIGIKDSRYAFFAFAVKTYNLLSVSTRLYVLPMLLLLLLPTLSAFT